MSLPKIYAAVDTDDLAQAKTLAAEISATGCGIKLGMTFFYAHGPEGLKAVMANCPQKPSIFLDLKFHDIPATVAGAVKSVGALGVDYINVHAGGGAEMMLAAVEAAKTFGEAAPKILAVTVLTSLDDENLEAVGQKTPVEEQVVRLALLARKCGMAGVVCSPLEIESLRNACGPEFVLMTPGIRPRGSVKADQKRVMTPEQALGKGASHLVIGRPITGAAVPAQAARDILADIAA